MSVIDQVVADTVGHIRVFVTSLFCLCILPQQEQVVLDKQVLDKQKAKLQLQQDKQQDAQDLAAAL